MTELVKTIDDLKSHIAIDFVSDFGVIEFAVEDREAELKTKYIGAELWANLVKVYSDTYSNSSSSILAKYEKVLWYCQRIICNYSFLDYIPEGQLHISENGISIGSTKDYKQAFPWQIENLEKKYHSTAVRNLELLLEYLNENIDVFSDWTSSPAYVANKKYFVNSATEFNDFSVTKLNHTSFLDLIPLISYVGDFYLRSILGDEFFEELQERILDSEDVDGSKSGSTSLSIMATNYDKLFYLCKGVVVNYVGVEASEMEEYNFNSEKCEQKASHFTQRLVEFLNNNASATLFTKYFESEKYTAPEESTSFTSGGGIDNSEFTGVYGAF